MYAWISWLVPTSWQNLMNSLHIYSPPWSSLRILIFMPSMFSTSYLKNLKSLKASICTHEIYSDRLFTIVKFILTIKPFGCLPYGNGWLVFVYHQLEGICGWINIRELILVSWKGGFEKEPPSFLYGVFWRNENRKCGMKRE
jgi:hypothetical protein